MPTTAHGAQPSPADVPSGGTSDTHGSVAIDLRHRLVAALARTTARTLWQAAATVPSHDGELRP